METYSSRHGLMSTCITHDSITLIAGKGFRQRVMRTTLLSNQRGGFHFRNAGELNPNVIIEQCRIEGSGYRMHNFTSPPVMYFNIQKSRLLTVSNNYIGMCPADVMTYAFRITGPLWRESTGHRWIPFTKGQWCVALIFYLSLAWKVCWQTVKLSVISDTRTLMWRHCNDKCNHTGSSDHVGIKG